MKNETSKSHLIWLGPRREGCTCPGGRAIPRQHLQTRAASCLVSLHPAKIRKISWGPMNLVSDIKLIKTDTTLELSQKAEKGILQLSNPSRNIHSPFPGSGLMGQCPISANANEVYQIFWAHAWRMGWQLRVSLSSPESNKDYAVDDSGTYCLRWRLQEHITGYAWFWLHWIT